MEQAVLKVQGMSCGHCVKVVEGALGELPSLSEVKVDLEGASVSFAYNPGETPLEAIKAAITEEGFTVL